MTQPFVPRDWCYQVVVRCSDGTTAHPNIQAPDEADCRRRIEVLYPFSTIVAVIPVHRAREKEHRQPSLRVFRRKDDLRPPERRIAVRRRPVPA